MPTQPFKDYYKILGVQPDSNLDEIKSAFRKKALDLHPDRNISQPESVIKQKEQLMKDVAEAWGILSRPEAKSKYDRIHQEYRREDEFVRPKQTREDRPTAPTPKRSSPFDYYKDWDAFQKHWDEFTQQYMKEADETMEKYKAKFEQDWKIIDERMRKSNQEIDERMRKSNQAVDEMIRESRRKTDETMDRIKQTSKTGGGQEEQKIKWEPAGEPKQPSEPTIKFGKSYKPHQDIKWGPVEEESSGEVKG